MGVAGTTSVLMCQWVGRGRFEEEEKGVGWYHIQRWRRHLPMDMILISVVGQST